VNKPKPLPRVELVFKDNIGVAGDDDGGASKALEMLVKYYAEENWGMDGVGAGVERICDVLFEKQLKKLQSVIK
jgi:hypothetical protein